jgi:hypothetical protein
MVVVVTEESSWNIDTVRGIVVTAVAGDSDWYDIVLIQIVL